MNRKFPEIILDNCQDCPNCEWVSEDCRPDAYKCKQMCPLGVSATIITDWANRTRLEKQRRQKQKVTKIPIPDWCPLAKTRKKVAS